MFEGPFRWYLCTQALEVQFYPICMILGIEWEDRTFGLTLIVLIIGVQIDLHCDGIVLGSKGMARRTELPSDITEATWQESNHEEKRINKI
jgi:hypothetical protein